MGLFDAFKKKSENDYSSLTAEQKKEMIEKGELLPLYLIGLRFGGSEKADNYVYAPKEAVAQKDRIDDELEQFMIDGRAIKGLRIQPVYKGKCSIPAKITIQAMIDGTEKFVRTIDIW